MTASPMGADQRPAFATAEECGAWLAATPLGNPVQAQAQMLRQLNLLNRQPIAALERLTILELLRKPLMLVQEEGARRFVGKSLPLAVPEQAAFEATQAVWQGQLAGYWRCIEAARGADPVLKPQLALLIQRALSVLALSQFDLYRTGFQPTSEHWRALHHLYQTAEQAGIADQEVEDKPRLGRNLTSPRALYVEVLLLHAASPHELPSRHLAWVAHWARRWSAKVRVLAAAPDAGGPIRPLCVDLASTEPAGFDEKSVASARWLDTAEVRISLKKRLSALDKGTAPADLQLGDDCVQPACGQLLKKMYRRWCKGGVARGQERQAISGTCALIAGVEAIHYFLSGHKSFRQPGFSDDEALRREREEIATFGRVANRQVDAFSQQQGFRSEEWQLVEEWQIVDESATGVHITRAILANSVRIGQGQLVALQPNAAQSLLLGCLRWTMVTINTQLHAGILVIPGKPEPVAVRVTDVAGAKEPYRPGFLLPGIAALGSVASVIIPPGYFRAGRIVETSIAKQQQRLRLLQLIDRGLDFDRASYEVVS